MNKKDISLRNYVYLCLIIFITIGIVYYLYLWLIEYKEEIQNTSILNEYLQVVNYNEINNYIVENDEVFLYVTTKKRQVLDFEYKLKDLVVKNNLEKDMVFLDVSNNLKNGKYEIYNNSFNGNSMFIVFKANQLISSYDIEHNDYNINKVENYLKSIGVLKDD